MFIKIMCRAKNLTLFSALQKVLEEVIHPCIVHSLNTSVLKLEYLFECLPSLSIYRHSPHNAYDTPPSETLGLIVNKGQDA